MRDKIKNSVRKVLGKNEENDLNINFGYDCIGIEITKDKELYFDDIDSLKYLLKTDICWIKINKKGNFVLCYDISNMILKEYGNWENYEETYELN